MTLVAVHAAELPVPIAIRPAREEERPLVFSSWLRTYARSPIGRMVAEPVFMRAHHAVLERLWMRAQTLVLTPEGDDATVLGWICSEPGVLHYVYVKGALRRAGLATALLEAAGGSWSTHTHRTALGNHLLSKLPNSIFNPWRLYENH